MTKIFFVRHGEPDYMPCDIRGFIGHGRDLAPLSVSGIKDAEKAAMDIRLTNAQLLISSPYTRALQTASYISNNIGLPLLVEVDLHEWIPDKTFQFSSSHESAFLNRDYKENGGNPPAGKVVKWESIEEIRSRVIAVISKYSDYDEVIMVCHQMVIQAITGIESVQYGGIVEFDYT